MTTNIYAWPPICARGVEHTVDQPIGESTSSLGSETRYTSSYAKQRSVVTLVISGRNNQGSAGGYINMMKRLIQGGRHLVRLSSQPAHFNLDWLPARGQGGFEWLSNGRDMEWTSFGSELLWSNGSTVNGTYAMDGDFHALEVTGLEPNTIVAYPDEIISSNGINARVLKLEYSDSDGKALIRTDAPLTTGPVVIGISESKVYKMEEIPRAVQYAGEDFEYVFNLREVFLDEITDGYEEIDPWR